MAGKTDYKNQFAKEKYDRVGLMLPKGMKAELLKHISETGDKSLNAFLMRAITLALKADMINEQKAGGLTMNITELNERIAQLTDLVSNAEETIKSTNEMIKFAEQERDRLANQRRKQEPKFERVKENTPYFSLFSDSLTGLVVSSSTEKDTGFDKAAYNNNNYFHTKKRAQEVANRVNFLLRLERLYDTFCPKYVPDWNNIWSEKWTVYFDTECHNCYRSARITSEKDCCGVYFPTKEIAQKACDILNAERSKNV